MATNNLAVRFTDETYASRLEVAKALGTNLIDSIWYQILSYRRGFAHILSLTDVNKTPYSVTLTSNLLTKSEYIETRFSKVLEEYDELKEESIEKATLKNDMYKSELRYLAKMKGIIINDVALDNIVKGRNINLLYAPLVNYFAAIKKIEDESCGEIDESLLANYLETLNGGGELLSFYRTSEISIPSQKVLINREYAGAPVSQIEGMMDIVLRFINDQTVNVAIKIASILYMIDYIKPFDSFNEEVGIIMAKCLLKKSLMQKSAAILPLENIFVENKIALNNAAKESQKSKDLTYYVNEVFKSFELAATTVLDRAVQVSRDATEKAFFEEQEEVKEEQPQIQVTPSYAEESVYVVPSVTQGVVTPIVAPSKPKAKAEPANNEPKVNVRVFQELDEKALNRAAEDLLESDPTLRPGQAHFYVRHCTLGKYYTIQQYKKAEGCVYETARTSMDNLARGGYYRREQVKNKFVYTPISKN